MKREAGAGTEECRRVAPLLPGLPDSDFPAEDRARVEAHLETCPLCREEAEAFQGLARLVKQEPVSELSLPTGAQAAAWIRERERSSRPWWAQPRLWLGGAVATGLAAALVFGPVAPFRSRPAPPAPEAAAPALAEESLPALVVVDDEKTGRQVLLAPEPSGS